MVAKGLRCCHNPLGFEIVFVFGDQPDEIVGGASLASQTTSADFRGEHKASYMIFSIMFDVKMNSTIQDVKRVRGRRSRCCRWLWNWG